jgi:lipopolysaccharide biosynthesis glycosyltransferase
MVRVATATDQRYLPYLGAMVRSLAVSRDSTTSIELTILHNGVTHTDRSRVEHGAEGVAVKWIKMTPTLYRNHGIESDPLVLTPHYYRCLIPRVYSDDVNRVVYLDADTLVLCDLGVLMEWPLQGQPVAAVGDLMSVIADAIAHWDELGLDWNAPYFNSGVMLMDLPQWRSEGIGNMALKRCLLDRHRLLIKDRWNQHDQYGLNVVLQHRWTRLPDRWNHFPERASSSPGIVHFLGDTKPGAPRTRAEFTELFCKMIDTTAWAGWRPPSTPVPSYEGTRRRPDQRVPGRS